MRQQHTKRKESNKGDDSGGDGMKSTMLTSDTMSTAKQNTALASEIVEVDSLSSDEDWGTEGNILRDVARCDDRFCNSRCTPAGAQPSLKWMHPEWP